MLSDLNDADVEALSLLDDAPDVPTDIKSMLADFKDKKKGMTEATLVEFSKRVKDMVPTSDELRAIREILIESQFDKKKMKTAKRFKPCAITPAQKARVAGKKQTKKPKDASHDLLRRLLAHVKKRP